MIKELLLLLLLLLLVLHARSRAMGGNFLRGAERKMKREKVQHRYCTVVK
jgi:hypothetical protein